MHDVHNLVILIQIRPLVDRKRIELQLIRWRVHPAMRFDPSVPCRRMPGSLTLANPTSLRAWQRQALDRLADWQLLPDSARGEITVRFYR